MHVGKRKRQSFANWFLFVDGEEITLVLLGTLRNDSLLGNDICPQLRLNSVRNRDRQDVDWARQILSCMDLVPLKSGGF